MAMQKKYPVDIDKVRCRNYNRTHKVIGGDLRLREWLRKIRVDLGLTELETAKKAGITQPFYHNIEMGIKNPSVDTAKRIASALGFPWVMFFSDNKEETEVSA